MATSSPPRVVCFIDGSNLYTHLTRAHGAGRVDLPKLCHQLTGTGRRFVEWRYYAAAVPQGKSAADRAKYTGQQRFFEVVKRHRKGVLRLGRFERGDAGAIREKGVDVLLAIDLVRLAVEDRYDVAIVFSGDGDLAPAVQMAQEIYGKRVEVAIPKVKAHHLRRAADAYLEITGDVYDAVKL